MAKTAFSCDHCGKPSETWTAWFKKRTNHYCSRTCKDTHNNLLRGFGLSRKEYEKQYWQKPENAARRKTASKAAHAARMKSMGDSVKRAILNRAKARAERDGVPFALSIEDFTVPSMCPVLGFPLAVGSKQGGSFNSPSLDRRIPALGYVKGNVAVISRRANMIKCDASLAELQLVTSWVASFPPEAPPA